MPLTVKARPDDFCVFPVYSFPIRPLLNHSLLQLVFNQTPQTATSLQINTSTYRPPSPFSPSSLTLIDIPGHPRIRGQFTSYLSPTSSTKVKGVIFVCDVGSLARNASIVGEYLQLVMQGLLAADDSGRGTVPLLVLGHKADLLPKKSGGVNAQAAVQRVKTILERELERRRRGAASGAGGMAALGEEEGGGTGVGAGLDITGDGKEGFKFEKWEGGEVDVRASWVDVKRSTDGHTTDEEEHEGEKGQAKGEDGLSEVVQWVVDLR